MKHSTSPRQPDVLPQVDYPVRHPSAERRSNIPYASLFPLLATTPQFFFISYKDAGQIADLSRSTLYDYVKRGLFPKPYRIGIRSVRFLLAEVEAWCDARIQAGPAQAVLVHLSTDRKNVNNR